DEGRAALWMHEHACEAGSGISDRRTRVQRVLDLATQVGGAPWIGDAVLGLTARSRDVDAEQLDALVEDLSAAGRPVALRATAMLARATLVQRAEPDRTAELRVSAADLVLDSEGALPSYL